LEVSTKAPVLWQNTERNLHLLPQSGELVCHSSDLNFSFFTSLSKVEMAATFSYAQAAKGVIATPSAANPASTEQDKPAPKTDEQSANSSVQMEPETTAGTAKTSQEAEKTAASTDKDSESTTTAPSKTNVSGTSSPSVGTSSTSTVPKEDESSNTPNGITESNWDKQSQASGTDKQSNAQDAKDKASASSDKDKKVPLKELKAAPLPAVNVWQQRKEAQEAKAKATAALKPASSAKPSASKTASIASSTSGDNHQELSKTAPRKKGADATSDGPKDKKRADGGKGRDESKFRIRTFVVIYHECNRYGILDFRRRAPL
jgi:la-related protein 1